MSTFLVFVLYYSTTLSVNNDTHSHNFHHFYVVDGINMEKFKILFGGCTVNG